MLGKKRVVIPMENSAMIASDASVNKVFKPRQNEKPRVWCDYGNKPRHTWENCSKIHGKAANWKSIKSK